MQKNIDVIIKNQRQFFNKGNTKSVAFRKESLKRLEQSIISNEDLIYNALKTDLGKCEFEAYTTEIGGVLREVRQAIKHIDSWSKPKRISTPLFLMPGSSYSYPEPYGIVLIMGPYNYPFSLIMNPLIGAISAGNTSVIRPSESASNTADILEKIITETFNEEHVIMMRGDTKFTEQLLKHKFDYIFFTGGVKVGKTILKAAAEHLTPTTLELGGKSPAIITESADVKHAANRIIWGKFINAGQTCIAPDYVLIHKSLAKNFIDNAKMTIHEFYGGNVAKNEEYGRIINKKHHNRLSSLIDAEREKVIHGGDLSAEDNCISPTLLYPVDFEDEIMEDEIFGPILPIIEYRNFDDMIEVLKTKEKSLALYLFNRDPSQEKIVLDELSFGGGSINETLLHYANDNLPFGGVGNSGLGAYHGKHSFNTFSHYKSVFKRRGGITIDLINPPFKNKLDLIKKILK